MGDIGKELLPCQTGFLDDILHLGLDLEGINERRNRRGRHKQDDDEQIQDCRLFLLLVDICLVDKLFLLVPFLGYIIYPQIAQVVDVFLVVDTVGVGQISLVVFERSLVIACFLFKYGPQTICLGKMFPRVYLLCRLQPLADIPAGILGLPHRQIDPCNGESRLQPVPFVLVAQHQIIGVLE